MSIYVKLAKSAAEEFIRTGEVPPAPPTLPPELLQQRGCYVSVFENPGHRLRSMHGEVLPKQPTLAEEIVANTIAAITAPQARHIRRQDLSYLVYGVSLLGPLQRVSDPEHLDPEHCGLYIRSDRGKSALLLPRRAGIETAQDQIGAAIREANINVHQESYTMYRFVVTYYDA